MRFQPTRFRAIPRDSTRFHAIHEIPRQQARHVARDAIRIACIA
jgi:hypothetical protein